MMDAMCDSVMEDLLSDEGQLARSYAAKAMATFTSESWIPAHQGHSWATPAAADGHAYFESLRVVAEGEGHMYFADAPVRPRARPDSLEGRAPETSPRPKARPNNLGQSEAETEESDKIELLLSPLDLEA